MFLNNPNSTPFWLLLIFCAVAYFGYPRIKRIMSRYFTDRTKQSFFAFSAVLVIELAIVTLSVIIGV